MGIYLTQVALFLSPGSLSREAIQEIDLTRAGCPRGTDSMFQNSEHSRSYAPSEKKGYNLREVNTHVYKIGTISMLDAGDALKVDGATLELTGLSSVSLSENERITLITDPLGAFASLGATRQIGCRTFGAKPGGGLPDFLKNSNSASFQWIWKRNTC